MRKNGFTVVEMIVSMIIALCILFITTNIYFHEPNGSVPWCDQCNGPVLMGPVRNFKGLTLCSKHYAKAVIISQAGQGVKSLPANN